MWSAAVSQASRSAPQLLRRIQRRNVTSAPAERGVHAASPSKLQSGVEDFIRLVKLKAEAA
jgi:hypothetical protein